MVARIAASPSALSGAAWPRPPVGGRATVAAQHAGGRFPGGVRLAGELGPIVQGRPLGLDGLFVSKQHLHETKRPDPVRIEVMTELRPREDAAVKARFRSGT